MKKTDLILPAVEFPGEVYSPERRAEFLLCNSVDAKDYASAVEEVRKIGLGPGKIPHRKPARVITPSRRKKKK